MLDDVMPLVGRIFWIVVAGLVSMPLGHADILLPVNGHPADYVLSEGPPITLAPGGASFRCGANANGVPGGRNPVFVFELPALPAGESLLSAELGFSVVGQAGTPAFAVDVWGLALTNSTTALLSYFEGPGPDPGASLIEDDIITFPTPVGTRITTTNAPGLVTFLNTFYDTHPGYSGSGWYAFIRLSPDADAGITSLGWSVAATENNNATYRPELVLTASGNPPQPDRPNFVFMITDDQRWDAVGVVQRELETQGGEVLFPYFKNETPNMDRIAAEGLRFRNAFVVLSLCSPSRATFLTGQYNHLNGVVNNSTPFPSSARTFATELRAAGYATGYFGKWHHGNQSARPGFTDIASYTGQGNFNNQAFLVNGTSTSTSGWVDDVATDFALDFMANNQTNSFVAVLGFKSPHAPRTPPSRHNSLYSSNPLIDPANRPFLPPYRTAPVSVPDNDVRNYFRCLKGVDDNVGRVLDRLDQLGIAQDTMVIFCSDNGYYLRSHGVRDKRTAYEESLRIPLLVRYPRLVGAPRTNDAVVLNIDLAPTLLDLAGVPIPPDMQGESWRPLLLDEPVAWRDSFFYEYFLEQNQADRPSCLAFRTPRAKLITYPGVPQWTELFDLTQDPHETNSLTGNVAFDDVYQDLLLRFNAAVDELELRLESTNLAVQADGTFRAELHGGIGPTYRIDTSTNLVDWTLFDTRTVTSPDVVVEEPAAPGPRRFYRFTFVQP